jgi:hypothetical protein
VGEGGFDDAEAFVKLLVGDDQRGTRMRMTLLKVPAVMVMRLCS